MIRGHLTRLVLLAVVVAAMATAVWCSWAWWSLHRPYAGWEGPAAEVVLEPGVDAGTALRRLADAGVVRHPQLARAWLWWSGRADRLHAGEYRFDRPATPLAVLGRLERGDVVLHAVTLPEGLTLVEIAERLGQAGLGTPGELMAAFGDPTPIHGLDAEATDLEGYLFPDTYHFPQGERPERIVAAMVARFRDAMGEKFVEEAKRSNLGLRGSVILASMIEKETSVPEERERISAVFHNRLERGMKLECDPTVIYAIERAGRQVDRLTYADLRFVSPWNTYVIPGLPVGPIANPGRESLLAALQPSTGNEIYFVASPDGGHRFSEDLASHLRAVAEWRRHVRSSR